RRPPIPALFPYTTLFRSVDLLEIGVSSPEPKPTKGLSVGEVGYLITGVKDVRQSRVGDTVTNAARPASEPVGEYRDPQPMVYSGDRKSTRLNSSHVKTP